VWPGRVWRFPESTFLPFPEPLRRFAPPFQFPRLAFPTRTFRHILPKLAGGSMAETTHAHGRSKEKDLSHDAR
jgi:hypothetical protein